MRQVATELLVAPRMIHLDDNDANAIRRILERVERTYGEGDLTAYLCDDGEFVINVVNQDSKIIASSKFTY